MRVPEHFSESKNHERYPLLRVVEVLCFLPSTHDPLYDFERAMQARKLPSVALASVSFGLVLVRVREYNT
jgi:hypothetical protein